MSGIFESQTIRGSSLKNESFIYDTPVEDKSDLVRTAATVGKQVYSKHLLKKATNEVETLESTLLDDVSANREDNAEIDQLRKVDESQGRMYDQAKKEITRLDEAIGQRGVNPAEAISRRNMIIQKYTAKAPLFKRQISSITTDDTYAFNATAQQMIKEENDARDEATELFGIPGAYDVPSLRDQYLEYKSMERNAQYVTSRTTVNSAEAAVAVTPAVTKYMNEAFAIMDTNITAVDYTQLSGDEKAAYMQELQQFTNGNEETIARQIISSLKDSQGNPLDPRFIDKEVIRSAASMIKGRAEARLAAASGRIPKEQSEYSLELAKNKNMLWISKNAPGTFMAMNVLPYLKDFVAGAGIEANVANDLARVLEAAGLGTIDKLSFSQMKDLGVENPKATQDLYAEGIDKSMDSWSKLDTEAIDKNVFGDYAGKIIDVVNLMADEPTEFSPKMFDVHISRVNDPVYMDWFKKLDPVKAKSYSDSVLNATSGYARQKMVGDISKELDKDYKSNSVRDLVSLVIDPNTGSMSFEGNTFQTAGKSEEALKTAGRLNRMYKRRFDSVLLTAKNLKGLKDDQQYEFMYKMFSDVTAEAGEPLRLKKEDTVETNRRVLLDMVKDEGVKISKKATTEELRDALDKATRQKAFDTQLEAIKKENDPFSGKASGDVFADVVSEITNQDNK